MSRKSLEAQPRKKLRKLRGMREDGFIPAVVYNQSGDSLNIKIPANDVTKFLNTLEGTPLIDLVLEGKTHIALLKEIQIDHRSNSVSHLSFMALDPKKKADIEVEIIETGESPAVRNNIGLLIFERNTIELRGLPDTFPNSLKADVSGLEKIGDSILVSDLNIPEGLEFIIEEAADYPVASIRPFQKTLEEELKEEEEAKAALEEEELTEADILEGEEAAEGSDEEDGGTEEDEAAEGTSEKPQE